jgi:hypothetical protein
MRLLLLKAIDQAAAMRAYLFGEPAQPNEMTDGQYAGWVRQPAEGDLVEFKSDRQTDKGPSSGRVLAVDGDRVKIAHSDCEEWFTWPKLDLERRAENGTWIIKGLLPQRAASKLLFRV